MLCHIWYTNDHRPSGSGWVWPHGVVYVTATSDTDEWSQPQKCITNTLTHSLARRPHKTSLSLIDCRRTQILLHHFWNYQSLYRKRPPTRRTVKLVDFGAAGPTREHFQWGVQVCRIGNRQKVTHRKQQKSCLRHLAVFASPSIVQQERRPCGTFRTCALSPVRSGVHCANASTESLRHSSIASSTVHFWNSVRVSTSCSRNSSTSRTGVRKQYVMIKLPWSQFYSVLSWLTGRVLEWHCCEKWPALRNVRQLHFTGEVDRFIIFWCQSFFRKMRTKSYQTRLIFNGIIQKKLKRRLSGGGSGHILYGSWGLCYFIRRDWIRDTDCFYMHRWQTCQTS